MVSSFLSAFAMRLPTVEPTSTLGTLLNVLLLGALVHAVWTDVRTRRISNRLTYPLMLTGLLLNGMAAGTVGFVSAAVGLVLGGAMLLIPCALGAMGAGDAKLLAAIGALKGPFFALDTLVYTGLAGGALALLYLLKYRRLLAGLGRLSERVLTGDEGAGAVTTPEVVSLRKASMPYAPAIAVGALYALFSYALH